MMRTAVKLTHSTSGAVIFPAKLHGFSATKKSNLFHLEEVEMYIITMDQRFGGEVIKFDDAKKAAKKAAKLIGGSYRITDDAGNRYWVNSFGKCSILTKTEE